MTPITDFHTHLAAPGAIVAVDIDRFEPRPHMLYAVGLHPWRVTADDARLDRLEALAHHDQVVAVGETGIDALRGASLDVQREAMRRHIIVAEHVGKPLVVHCVRTSQQIIKLWRDTAPHHVALVVHGFRGNERVAQALLNEGFYLSFGEHFNPRALAVTPLERLLIETDDAPVSIEQVAATVAAQRGITPAALLTQVARTATTLVLNDF